MSRNHEEMGAPCTPLPVAAKCDSEEVASLVDPIDGISFQVLSTPSFSSLVFGFAVSLPKRTFFCFWFFLCADKDRNRQTRGRDMATRHFRRAIANAFGQQPCSSP